MSAILWRLGVTMSGLCQETSFQPRSSASITTRRKVIYSDCDCEFVTVLSLIFGGFAASQTKNSSVRIDMKSFIIKDLY